MAADRSLSKSVPGIWRVLRYFWPRVRRERALIGTSLLALMAGIVFRLAEPWPLKFVIDHVIGAGGTASPMPGWLEGYTGLEILTGAAIAVVVMTGLRAACDYWNRIGFAKIAIRVLRRVRGEVYTHVQGLSMSFHTRARTGDLIVRVTRDVGLLRDVTAMALLPLVASVLVLAGMLTLMLVMSWKLALLAMVTVPLFWLVTARISKKIHVAARGQRKREGAMAATASESITAIRDVQAMSLEGNFTQNFNARNAMSQKEDLKTARLSAQLGRTVDLLLAISTALVLWVGARLVLAAEMSAGDLIVFLAYLKRAFKPAKDFAKYTARLARAAAAGERVIELLEEKPEVADRPDAIVAQNLTGAVRFENVSFEYEPGTPVLRNVDFTVEPGTFVAVTGHSGVGKSTLASLMLRLYEPTEGRILLDGVDVRDYTMASLRSQVSVVLQDAILFAASVRDNISCGVPEASPEEVESAALLANADGFIRELPEGYETMLGERGATISKGQRQRISIARAAMRETPLLILDEPTTGLDVTSDRIVTDALRKLARGRTSFLVTHDLEVARSADLVVHFAGDSTLECGSPEELLRAGGDFAARCAFGRQARAGGP